MAQRVLVIDPDVAFATLLKEGLEMTQSYQVTTANDGRMALDASARERFALVVVDMGLADPPAVEMARAIREKQPDVPLMVIPVDGDAAPPEMVAIGINGVLTKPFFLPDLPALVTTAITGQAPEPGQFPSPFNMPAPGVLTSAPTPAPAAPPSHSRAAPPPPPPSRRTAVEREPAPSREPSPLRESSAPRQAISSRTGRPIDLSKYETTLTSHLNALSREINAEAVMVTAGDRLVSHVGRFTRQEAEQLALGIIDSWAASARVAELLGREQVRFEQSLHEGGDYLLYSLSAAEGIVLSIVLRGNTPLGMIRYHAKRTAESIARIAQRAAS